MAFMHAAVKRFLSLFLIVSLFVGALPVPVAAAGMDVSDAPVSSREYISNPLYSFLEDDAPIGDGLFAVESPTLSDDPSDYCSLEEAAEQLRDAMVARESSVTLYVYSPDIVPDMETVLLPMALSEDRAVGTTAGDYLKWSWKGMSSAYSYSGGYYAFGITITYYTTAAQETALLNQVDAVMEDLALQEQNCYQKCSLIYEYISDHVDYDYDALERINAGTAVTEDDLIFSAYGALMNGKAVCQGYACLFYAMCRSAGLPVRVISNDNHAWNIVQLGDLWYNMDVTWDGQSTVSNRNYFLKGSDSFTGHTPDDEFLTDAFTAAYPISETDYAVTEADLCTQHSYDDGTTLVERTCTQEGETLYTCTTCGATKTQTLSAMGHRESRTIVVEATCTEGGYTARGCERCDYYYIETTTEALGHAYTAVITEPTCTEGGCTTHACSRCGVSYTDSATAALGHQWDSGVVTKEATETEDGETTYTCTRCSETRTELISMIVHSYDSGQVTTEATCTDAGIMTYTCEDCGKTYTEELPAAGHSWDSGSITGEATCMGTGTKTYTCTVCGEVKTEVITATGHRHQTVTIEPSCTVDGSTVATCIYCGDSYVVTSTPALGHDWDETEAVVTAPGCETEGYTTYTCARCGETKIEDPLSPLGHDFQCTDLVEADCATAGCRIETCTRCSAEISTVLPAVGHHYSASVIAPTCLEAGYTVHTCLNCGHSYRDNETDPLGHSYEATVTAATCTQPGGITYTCRTCQDSYFSGSTSALGHSWDSGTVVQEASCTVPGIKRFTCTACGETKTETSAAPGHDYMESVTAATCTQQGYTTYTCRGCGHCFTEDYTDALGHQFDSGVLILAPTAAVQGQMRYTCQRCSHSKVEAVPATGIRNPFSDVEEGKFYYEPVLWAVERNVTTGMTETTFGPDNTCTRAQVVTFLWRAAGEPEPTITECGFTDVDPNAFYYKAMLWAVEKGITNGVSVTSFDPNGKCIRAQVVTFLWRVAGKPNAANSQHGFTDVDSNDYYYQAVLWAVEAGITNGMSATTFGPKGNCTRGQVVTFLYRYYE